MLVSKRRYLLYCLHCMHFLIFGWERLVRILQLTMYMNQLLPIQSDDIAGARARFDVASGIYDATASYDEQAMLVTIARWETGFQPRYVYCSKRSSVGASGPFQVIPRSVAERDLLCKDMMLSAKIALQRVSESRKFCTHLPVREQLAQYTTGRCDELGKRMSRLRWSTNAEMMSKISKCYTTSITD